jgi:heat shock protein HslJ
VKLSAAILPFALAACVAAPRPDPALDLTGEWEITHVNGEATNGGETFWLAVRPPQGSAQFGCNIGGGSLAVGNGWLRTGNWIITVAGCPGDRGRFERTGFNILAEPAAIEANGTAGIRLHNRRGTIWLRPMPPLKLEGTNWKIALLNERHVGDLGGTVRFEPHYLAAGFCNTLRTTYRQEAFVIHTAGYSTTERGCDPAPGEPNLMLHDKEAWAVFRTPVRVERVRPDAIRLVSDRGRMLLERAP